MTKAKVAYHGTPHADAVLREGLRKEFAPDGCKHIWFAERPENVSPTWGEILEVDVEGLGVYFSDDPYDGWQYCYHGDDIPPERIRRFLGG